MADDSSLIMGAVFLVLILCVALGSLFLSEPLSEQDSAADHKKTDSDPSDHDDGVDVYSETARAAQREGEVRKRKIVKQIIKDAAPVQAPTIDVPPSGRAVRASSAEMDDGFVIISKFKQVDCSIPFKVLKSPGADTEDQLNALEDLNAMLVQCVAPELRGLNKIAEFCNSVLEPDVDGLTALKELQDNRDANPLVREQAKTLLEKIVPNIWSV